MLSLYMSVSFTLAVLSDLSASFSLILSTLTIKFTIFFYVCTHGVIILDFWIFIVNIGRIVVRSGLVTNTQLFDQRHSFTHNVTWLWLNIIIILLH